MLIIDPDSGTPPYAQLRQQLIMAIRTGELPPGSKLPTVRRLAGDLGIAPNTVARTYQELEREGAIETRGRRGSFVPDARSPDTDELRKAADNYAKLVRKLRVDESTAIRVVRSALGEGI
jgi:DNA-binding transcriptional regulator YhcF (GntR family)